MEHTIVHGTSTAGRDDRSTAPESDVRLDTALIVRAFLRPPRPVGTTPFAGLTSVVLHDSDHRVLGHARGLEGCKNLGEVVVELLQHRKVFLPRLSLLFLLKEIKTLDVFGVCLQRLVDALGGEVEEQRGPVIRVLLRMGLDDVHSLATEQLGRVGTVGGEVRLESVRIRVAIATVPGSRVRVVV